MSRGFGSQPVISTDKGWEDQLKLNDGQGATVVPLHALDESLTVFVHSKQVKVEGAGFRYVPSGKRNGHLFPPCEDAFDRHPDEAVRKVVPRQFMLVYVERFNNSKLEGHVAYLELKLSMIEAFRSHIAAQREEGVDVDLTKTKWRLSRSGKGQNDSRYTAAFVAANVSLPDNPELDKEVEKVQKYLLSLYKLENPEETLNTWFHNCLAGNSRPVVAKQEDNNEEMPF